MARPEPLASMAQSVPMWPSVLPLYDAMRSSLAELTTTSAPSLASSSLYIEHVARPMIFFRAVTLQAAHGHESDGAAGR